VNVICTDGTRFSCDSYELTEKGVKLYSGNTEAIDEQRARYQSDIDEYQIGFVPDERLQYILPDGVYPAQQPVVGKQQPQSGAQSRQGGR